MAYRRDFNRDYLDLYRCDDLGISGGSRRITSIIRRENAINKQSQYEVTGHCS